MKVCILLTSWPSVLLYALALTCMDLGHTNVVQMRGYAIVLIAIFFAYWYLAVRLASKSLIFALLIFLPLCLDMLVEFIVDHAYGVSYSTVIETAFDATAEQTGGYISPLRIAVLLCAIIAVVTYAIMGKIARRGVGNAIWKDLTMWVVIILASSVILLKPIKYYMSHYVKYIPCYFSWGDAVRDASVDNPDFCTLVDDFHLEMLYLPHRRCIWWYNGAIKHFFPKPVINSADAESEDMWGEGVKVNVVLYIVESFRSDHTPFAGYHRNTMPNLYGRHKENMIFLPNFTSFGTHSVQSLYGILSDADDTSRDARHTSFQAIFRKHGFNCILLENNAHGAPWTPRAVFNRLLKDSYDTLEIVYDDNNFPPIVDKYMAGHDKNMLVIYDGTSHYPYSEGAGGRYGNEMVDRYDETRHVIDNAAGIFLDFLSDTPSIVLISSDHGQSFGEGGRICHGGPLSAKEQRAVFAAIWYSDKYAEQFPDVVNAIKENASAFDSQDQIFHTMPSMGGIHSALRKVEWDMTIPHAQHRSKDFSKLQPVHSTQLAK